MIDFKKFYNANFLDQSTGPIDIGKASTDMASTLLFTPEYNFSQVPDLSLNDLVNELIMELPRNFIFIKSRVAIINTALETICKEIRPDISFINLFGDIDKEWYDWAVTNLLLSGPYHAHLLYTVWKLDKDGITCGLVGDMIGFVDTGVITKNTVLFSATDPNWQIVDNYNTISVRLLSEHCKNLMHPNFILLLSRAWAKLLNFDQNWLGYRTVSVNRILPGHFAMSLRPLSSHDIKSMNDQPTYPRYPGLITRDRYEVYLPLKSFL